MITVTIQCEDTEKVDELLKKVENDGGTVLTYTDTKFVNHDALLAAIERATGVTVDALRSKDRHYNNTAARSIYVNLMSLNGISRTALAVYLHRDHSSVVHHIKDFPNRVRYDLRFRLLVAKVCLQLELSERIIGLSEEQCRDEIHKLSSIYDAH